MIYTAMRDYDYFLLGEDDYGQHTLQRDDYGEPVVQGTVKMTINITSQAIQDNLNYSHATYLGLTHDYLNDNYVIQYGDKKLKVLYVNSQGRYTQVFMGDYNG